jgi:hypothetical protein
MNSNSIPLIISVAILLTCVVITLILLTKLKNCITVMSEMRNALVALCNMVGVQNIQEIVSGDVLPFEEPEEKEFKLRLE